MHPLFLEIDQLLQGINPEKVDSPQREMGEGEEALGEISVDAKRICGLACELDREIERQRDQFEELVSQFVGKSTDDINRQHVKKFRTEAEDGENAYCLMIASTNRLAAMARLLSQMLSIAARDESSGASCFEELDIRSGWQLVGIESHDERDDRSDFLAMVVTRQHAPPQQ